MTMEINAQDLLNAITQQRDALANENAQLKAYIAKLEREVERQEKDSDALNGASESRHDGGQVGPDVSP